MGCTRKKAVTLTKSKNTPKLIFAIKEHLKLSLVDAKNLVTNLPYKFDVMWNYEAHDLIEKFKELAEIKAEDVLVRESYDHGNVQVCSGELEEALQWYRSLPPHQRKLAEMFGYLVQYKLI